MVATIANHANQILDTSFVNEGTVYKQCSHQISETFYQQKT